MKILKRIFLAIIGLIALLLVVALFAKKDYSVVRDITINRSRQEVFDYVKNIKNQNFYSKWNMTDPNAVKTYTGTDGTIGFIASWDSKMNDVGQGEQEIKKIQDGERLDMELRFIRPFKATDYAYMTTESIGGNQTKVNWGFYGKMDYPMNIMLLMYNMDKTLGGDMNTGLTNLKAILEKN